MALVKKLLVLSFFWFGLFLVPLNLFLSLIGSLGLFVT